ncbi:unnamed protein product [Rotaria sordida]|uniref:Uncharacterized protein n=1 Tax=Rotaria sordida TaxID=392033 RepID=A0A815VXL7_9BILA|nr:unnamed protein product [Rotaria sordida]CAF1533733.1 unnamed protein product [Rotaria sordida]
MSQQDTNKQTSMNAINNNSSCIANQRKIFSNTNTNRNKRRSIARHSSHRSVNEQLLKIIDELEKLNQRMERDSKADDLQYVILGFIVICGIIIFLNK